MFCHFVYNDALRWLNYVLQPKNVIFMQTFAMSATPACCSWESWCTHRDFSPPQMSGADTVNFHSKGIIPKVITQKDFLQLFKGICFKYFCCNGMWHNKWEDKNGLRTKDYVQEGIGVSVCGGTEELCDSCSHTLETGVCRQSTILAGHQSYGSADSGIHLLYCIKQTTMGVHNKEAGMV